MMIKVISLLLYLFLAPFAGALLDGVDRKITARMQGRKGPKLLQPFYDLIKLFSKQMIAVNSVQLLLNLSYLAFLAIRRRHLVLWVRYPDVAVHLVYGRHVPDPGGLQRFLALLQHGRQP